MEMRNESSGCGEPAGEVGFEGSLIDVAFSGGFAGFVHDVVDEEFLGGCGETIYCCSPFLIAAGLLYFVSLGRGQEWGLERDLSLHS